MKRSLRALAMTLVLLGAAQRSHADDAGAKAAQDAPATAAAGAAAAADTAREIPLRVSPGENVALGSVITLGIRVVTKPGDEVSVPEQVLAPFELLDRRVSETADAAGTRTFAFELDVQAFDVGEQTLPKLSVRVVGPNGELSELHTAPRTITITSPLANEPSAAPKPPALPVSVMEDDYTLAWIGGGVLAVALIAGLTLLIARYLRRRPKPVLPPPPAIPAWDQALSKLAALSASRDAMLAETRGAEFVEAVGNVAREYLGHRYGFDGLERTTDELMHTLEDLRPGQLSLSSVSLLLEQCDLVKFARVTPDQAVCDELFGAAEKLVRSSIPGGGRL